MNDARRVGTVVLAAVLCATLVFSYGASVMNNVVLANASAHELASLANNTGGSVDANKNGITDVVDWCASCAGGTGGGGGGTLSSQGGTLVQFTRAPSNLPLRRYTSSIDNGVLEGIQLPYTAQGRVTHVFLIGSGKYGRSWDTYSASTGAYTRHTVDYVQSPQTNLVIDWDAKTIKGYVWEQSRSSGLDYDATIFYEWNVQNAQSNVDHYAYRNRVYDIEQCGVGNDPGCPFVRVDFATKRILTLPLPMSHYWYSGQVTEYG